jgi:hypothetical protein
MFKRTGHLPMIIPLPPAVVYHAGLKGFCRPFFGTPATETLGKFVPNKSLSFVDLWKSCNCCGWLINSKTRYIY